MEAEAAGEVVRGVGRVAQGDLGKVALSMVCKQDVSGFIMITIHGQYARYPTAKGFAVCSYRSIAP